MAALIAKPGDCFSHLHPLSTGPIRPIRLIRPVCPRGFPPAPLPFAEGLFLSGIVVGQVRLVGQVRFV